MIFFERRSLYHIKASEFRNLQAFEFFLTKWSFKSNFEFKKEIPKIFIQVILTVRSSKEIWSKSFINFFATQERRLGRWASWLLEKVTKSGLAGRDAQINQMILEHGFYRMFGIGKSQLDKANCSEFFDSMFTNIAKTDVAKLENAYTKHNEHVMVSQGLFCLDKLESKLKFWVNNRNFVLKQKLFVKFLLNVQNVSAKSKIW